MIPLIDRRLTADIALASLGAAAACAGVVVAVLAARILSEAGGAAPLRGGAAGALALIALPLVAPVAAAVGPFVALARWSRSGAWAGLQASGVGPARLALPALALGALLGMATAWGLSVGEPRGRARLAEGARGGAWGDDAPTGVFIPLGEAAHLRIDGDDPATRGMTLRWSEPGRRDGWLLARQAHITSDPGGPALEVEGGQVIWPSGSGEALGAPEEVGRETLPLPGLGGGTRPPAALTDGELQARIDAMARDGRPAYGERGALARRRALPALCPLLALMAVPLALGRGGAPRAGAGAALLLATAGAVRLFEALGAAGHLPPTAAAWAPVGLSAALAALLWRRPGGPP